MLSPHQDELHRLGIVAVSDDPLPLIKELNAFSARLNAWKTLSTLMTRVHESESPLAALSIFPMAGQMIYEAEFEDGLPHQGMFALAEQGALLESHTVVNSMRWNLTKWDHGPPAPASATSELRRLQGNLSNETYLRTQVLNLARSELSLLVTAPPPVRLTRPVFTTRLYRAIDFDLPSSELL